MSYKLYMGDLLLGEMKVTDSDFPWLNCSFSPTTEFQRVKPLFDRSIELFNAAVESDEYGAWDNNYDEIMRLGIRIVDSSDLSWCNDFLLHIDGDSASFRFIEFHNTDELVHQ